MGLLKKIGETLAETTDQLRAQEIRHFCGRIPGVEQIAVCRPRTWARVAGRVQSIRVNPRMDRAALEVQIYDGTDHLTGVWLGRRKIPGIDLARGLILEGTLTRHRDRGLQITNPAYELLPEETG